MASERNPDVINTIQVLASTHKAHKKKGRAGRIQQEKRRFELGVLELFKNEGQKLLQAKKEKQSNDIEDMASNAKKIEELTTKDGTFSSFTSPPILGTPPPYEKDTKSGKLYPQLPVISHEGNYHLQDDNGQVLEEGQAETTIKMIPTTKKKKMKTSGIRGSLKA